MTDTENFDSTDDAQPEEVHPPHPDHPNDLAPMNERFSEFPPGYGYLGYMTKEENAQRQEKLWADHNEAQESDADEDDEKYENHTEGALGIALTKGNLTLDATVGGMLIGDDDGSFFSRVAAVFIF